MTLISVVIPCFNQGAYLEEAVESVLAQSHKDIEIVIVNDGSTDPYTNDLLSSYAKPECRVLHTDNQGLPTARNTGIRVTRGDYICCLDADDKYHFEYFSKAVAVLEQDRELRYGAIPAWVQFFGSSTALWKTMGHNIEGFESFMQGLRNNIQSATMFRRICWEKIGGFGESMTSGYEDWDFWIKMLHLGYQWFCIEEPLIYYRQKETSMVTRADEVRDEILSELINRNREFYTQHMMAILLARDSEVFQLQKENRILTEKLAVTAGNDELPELRSGFSRYAQRAKDFLKKNIPGAEQ